MGADIHGMVECRLWHVHEEDGETGEWHAAIGLDVLYAGQDYDAFGCLFGVRNDAGFRPLAAGRGLPADTSGAVRAELSGWGADAHSASWISWAEVARVDWDEPAESTDRRVHRYRRTADGLSYEGKSVWDPAHAAALAARGTPPTAAGGPPDGAWWQDGAEWAVGDTVFRAVRLRRRDAVPPDGEWQPVWTTMRTLAALHGEDNVRLVVWFDN
ncbi:hypothetical protein [Actinacidiphila alni]|uniref:hypothetical protein n=1 Tax=Actinacidiphila alni TaxID=380248 RepID=UPI003456B7A4